MTTTYLDIHPEVAAALAEGKPVVALESTIISHGMPYPRNVETALMVEQTVRDAGAVHCSQMLCRAMSQRYQNAKTGSSCDAVCAFKLASTRRSRHAVVAR